MFNIEPGSLVKAFPFALLGLFAAAYKVFGAWPVPQIVTFVFVVLFRVFREERTGWTSKHDFGVFFSLVLAVSVAFGLSLQYQGTVQYGGIMPSFLVFFILFNALNIEEMFSFIGIDDREVCNRYAFFGLGEDIDWVGYTRSVVDKDKEGQVGYMTRLVEKYHPVYCDASCKSVCVFTFDKIQEYSKDLITKYY